MNTSIVMIDELYIASNSDDQGRQNITRRNICALDFLSEKFGGLEVRRCRQIAYQSKELVTVRRCQDDRRPQADLPFIFTASISVSCVHIDQQPVSRRSPCMRAADRRQPCEPRA